MFKQTLRAILPLSALLFYPGHMFASNGQIGLFFQEGGGICAQNIPCSQSATLYVYAILDGASAQGITGAEYGLQIGADGGPDDGWMFDETFNETATAVLGNGFWPPDENVLQWPQNRKRGVNIAFPRCQTGTQSMLMLETVEIYNTGCLNESLPLLITGHDTESNRFFRCPLFTLCDAPAFTKVCLGDNLETCQNRWPPYAWDATCSTSGLAVINPGVDERRGCLETAIARSSWGAVKQMFRD